MLLQFVEPRLEPEQPFWTEMKHTESGVFLTPLIGDHACAEKRPQMAAHSGGGEPGGICQFAGAHGPAAEELDDMPTCGVRQGAEQSIFIHCHADNS